MSEQADDAPQRLVWDLPLRVFHWLLVLSVLASWLTGQAGYDYRPLHIALGYWMLGLITFRLLWGIVGTRHSRFASFLPGPRRLVRFLRDTFAGRSGESVGHNPLGSLGVLVMLGLLGLQAVSGLFIFDDIMHGGPWHASVSEATAEAWSDVHHTLVNVILGFAIAHVLAVGYYTLWKGQPLVRAMWHGRKSSAVVPRAQAIDGSRLGVAVLVALASAAFVYWLVAVAPGG